MVTYKQEIKSKVRHQIIKNAVNLLTTNRSNSCCVRRSYVRDIYDYYKDCSESHEQNEIKKIDVEYIKEWERMHTTSIGRKSPEELSVCYLSGPEPENDFLEFVSIGVKPQNIWAFESEKNIYLHALSSINSSDFMQPKLIKGTIEHFFETSPKTFDIVYIDACGSLVSDQHALRCISTLFEYQRLNSPGILISNFSLFDDFNDTNRLEYIDMIAKYNVLHSNENVDLHNILSSSDDFNLEIEKTKRNSDEAYGNFITAMICNCASIAIPTYRFCASNYLRHLSTSDMPQRLNLSFSDVDSIKNNTLYKYFALNYYAENSENSFNANCVMKKLLKEICGKEKKMDYLICANKIHSIRSCSIDICDDVKDILDFFDGENMYQFLDKPNRILFYDSVINQLAYPMHYVCDKAKRIMYKAKQKKMFTDLLLFDGCRYIYDWMPPIHQITSAFSNPSWQYTYRFALDGLIKQRMNYNNEFFFQGSVVSKNNSGFEAKYMPPRSDYINGGRDL